MSALKTRKPTGKAPWPLVLLEGEEKAGKSYACAAFSASPRIGRVFYFDIGEGAADQYGAIEGARYEVVDHDGSYRDILGQLQAVCALDAIEQGRPNVIIIDALSNIWGMLCDEAQAIANARSHRRGRGGEAEAQITMDLWNQAKRKWHAVLDLLKGYEGVVIATARGKEIAEVENGTPTGRSIWKVEGEKSLSYDVDVWVRLTRENPPLLVGARSLKVGVQPGVDRALALRDFTLERLIFDVLGVGEDAGPRNFRPLQTTPNGAPTTDFSQDPAWQRQSARFDAIVTPHGELGALFKRATEAMFKVESIRQVRADHLRDISDRLERLGSPERLVDALEKMVAKYLPAAAAAEQAAAARRATERAARPSAEELVAQIEDHVATVFEAADEHAQTLRALCAELDVDVLAAATPARLEELAAKLENFAAAPKEGDDGPSVLESYLMSVINTLESRKARKPARRVRSAAG